MKDSLRYINDVLGVRELLVEDEPLKTSKDENRVEGSGTPNPPGGLLGAIHNDFQYLVDEKTLYSFRHIPSHLIINFDNDPAKSIFVEPQKDLFQKMVSALQISVQGKLALQAHGSSVDEMLRDLAQKIKTPIKILVLSNDPSRSPEERLGLHRVFQTFSPRVLLEKPELKRAAWATMQRFQNID